MNKLLQIFLMSFLIFTINAQNFNNSSSFPFKSGNTFIFTNSVSNKVFKSPIKQNQIVKIINVTKAGTLNSLLTNSEKKTVTNLTVTGNLDARDFKNMRDSMPVLSVLDMSAVTIDAYSGSEGTNSDYTTFLPNEIPETAFYAYDSDPDIKKSALTSIVLPRSLTSIGDMAFIFCNSLTSISISASITQIGHIAFVGCSAAINVDQANPNYSSIDGVLFDKAKTTLIQCPLSITGNYVVPSSVDSIEMYGFCFCDRLISVNIPSSVASIGVYAFTSCSGMINIDTNNPNYTSIDGVFFNKSASKLIQCPTSTSGSYIIPSTVDTLGDNSFYNCRLMTAVTMPSSIRYIADWSFYNCSGLTSITVNSLPLSLSSMSDVFNGVNKSTCILNVPYGTKSLYQTTAGWNSFSNIIENTHGFILETNKLLLASDAGSKSTVTISSNDPWTATSNQSWLNVIPESGSGDNTITITADANYSTESRTAKIIVSADGIQSQTILVTQSGIPKTLNVTAGGLSTIITALELSSIINLKLNGTIDARDFKTMRDNMPKLSYIDLSEVSIVAYNGTAGTVSWITAYPANRLPDYAFNLNVSSYQKSPLTKISFPSSITEIGDYAFYSCGALTEIVIPNTVTYIGNSAFSSCYSLAKVILPDNITSIENNAFTGIAVSEITIPNKVLTIGQYAFSYCKNLQTVNIPDLVSTVMNSAFENCTAMTNLTIGNSVKYIGNSAFSGCSSLSAVVIPNSVTTMDGFAFGKCTNLKSVTLPNTLATIGYFCFYECTSLTDIIIPNSVTKIDYSAFSNCKSLTNLIIPNYVTYIGNSTFSYCSSLTNMTIPNSVSTIGSYAFDGCTGLSSMNVYRDVPLNLSASTSVFSNVNKTTCILNVPFGTKNLYAAANQWQDFNNIVENTHGMILNTDSVKLSSTEGSKASVAIKSNDQWTCVSNQTWLKLFPETGMGNDTLKMTANVNVSSLKRTAIVTVTSGEISKTITVIQSASPKIVNITAGGLVSTLTAAELSTITNLTISGTINARDFKIMRDSMPSLTTLDLSSVSIVAYTGGLGTAGSYSYTYPVNEIPQYAFFNSSTYVGKTILITITLPTSATTIGNSAFQYCSGLTQIHMPNSINSIGSSAFQRCSGLTEIRIPNIVKTIGDNAFQYCSGLTSLVIPDSLASVNWNAFSYCTNLKNVTIGSSLTSIGYAAFQNCTLLSSVNLTNSLKTIGDHAFEYTGLTNLIIPESVTSIGYSSFGSCKDLSEIILPNSLTTINDAAFNYCSGLKKITLGNAVTTIKGQVFYGCTNLMSIVIPETVSSIGSNVFNNCTGLMSITANPMYPINLSSNQNVFSGVDKIKCILNVPYQTKTLYAAADQWKDFTNVVENPNGLKIDLNAARLSPKAGSNVNVNVISNTDWKAVSNQNWLSVSNITGSGNKLITISADENGSVTSRMALVTVSVNGVPDKIITITQAAASKTVQITAGGLSSSLTPTELSTVSNLILTGTIDARDFKTMRDNMPLLSDIDLSGTNIETYTGTEGTYSTSSISYSASAIPQYAFYSWSTSKAKTSLIYAVLPASALSIGYNAFQNCSGLFSIKLPEKLTTIGDYAFKNCTGLVEISFPNSLLTIGTSSFSGCKGLASMNFGSSLITINNNAFEYCSALRTIVLPNSLTTLGGSVFQNCTDLTDFTFGNKISSTGSSTFMHCLSLKKVVLSNSVTTIGNASFQSCTNLMDIIFGNSLVTISSGAFSSCSKLDNIVIPNTVTTIEFRAFMSCSSLKNITLSNSLTAISNETFYGCGSISEITIPNSVTVLGDGAFNGCSSLNKINFGSSVSSIGSFTFGSCNALIDVIIPNSVRTIKSSAFLNSFNLSSISIPAGISSLGDYSLSCSGLKTIYSLAPVPLSLSANYVFSYVNKTTCILYVPQGSKALYQAAIQWKDFTSIIEMTTAVPNILDSKIIIYPNPVTDGFIINGFEGKVLLQLTDLNGKALYKKQVSENERISVNSLPKGIYIVSLSNNTISYQKKLIKE